MTIAGQFADTERPLSLWTLVSFALRHRLLTIILPLAFATAVVVWGVFQGRSFTSAASFVPMSQSAGGGQQMLSGLAAQIGVVLPTQATSQSPDFYIYLLRSQPVLAAVASAKYQARTDTGMASGDLMTHWNAEGDTPAARLDWTVKRLNEALSTVPGIRTGVVRFTVRSKYADLSQQIASQFLQRLDDFNRKGRQSRANAERQFVQEQLATAKRELGIAEQALLAFSTRNRSFEPYADAAVRREQLNREVFMRQQIYVTLAQAFEQSKIEEVRDTPVLSILEPPIEAARGDSRGLAKRGILLTIFGSIIGSLIALTRDFLRNRRGDVVTRSVPPESRSFP